MDHITFARIRRAIERESDRRGYRGDALAEYDSIPLVGTPRQQWDIATIGVDIGTGPLSTRDRELVDRMIRGAVLTGGAPVAVERPQQPTRRQRAW